MTPAYASAEAGVVAPARFDDGDLTRGLIARLPGLPEALDEELMARRITEALCGPGCQVHRVIPGTFWYQADGSCSLRYRVAVSASPARLTEHTVLARVAANGLTLSLFPDDPVLPTLARAMDLAALAEEWPSAYGPPASVELVHHPRHGAAVLRYRVRPDDAPAAAGGDWLYGKVYPDAATGERVQRFLQSWVGPDQVSIPVAVGYTPRLHLLLTAALPGEPALPRLLSSVARSGAEPAAASTYQTARDLLHATGRALAALHRTRRAAAPVRAVSQLTRDLDAELDLVQAVWPEVASRLRTRRAGLETESAGPRVLCHGDFTPAQVLVVGTAVTGIVDLDTACWGDPALDLGRFLAHLDLLVAKDGRHPAELTRTQLADHFLTGYADGAGLVAIDQPLLNRIAQVRTMSLLSTALHACRQLKERRLQLALSLLETATNTPTSHPTGRTTS